MRIGKCYIVTAAACVWALTMSVAACFAYSSADVDRAAKMVAAREHRSAVELLMGIAADSEFCAQNPADAARAGMLLCDAYDGLGDKSAARKSAADATQYALVQMWVGLKDREPDGGKRLRRVGEVCSGHPQVLAEFLKPTLKRLVALHSGSELSSELGCALDAYKVVLGAVSDGNALPDTNLLIQIGEHYTAAAHYAQATAIYDELLAVIPEESRDVRMRIMVAMIDTLLAANDPEGVVTWGKRYIAMPVSGPCKPDVTLRVAQSLERVGRKEEAAKLLKSVTAGDDLGAARVSLLAYLGDLLLRLGKHRDAAEAYGQIVSIPTATVEAKASAAYKTGLCYWEQGYKAAAVRRMTSVSQQYSTTPWAQSARERLYEWSEQLSGI